MRGDRVEADGADEPADQVWPFVGRAAELAAGRRALDDERGLLIVGQASVGKTRLAHELLAGRPGEQRWHRVAGVRGLGSVAFGAWSHLLPDTWSGGVDDALAWRALADHIRGPDGTIRLAVDDAQWLDPPSAALLQHLVAAHRATAVITARREEAVAAPITALWKDDLVTRIDLARFSLDEVDQLLEAALRAPVEPRTVSSLHGRTGGDPLLVRELVDDARRNGSLRLVHGAWVEVAPTAPGTRVVDLLAERIDALDADERAGAEVLAVGDPLPADLLDGLVPASIVEQLITRGLVRIEVEDPLRIVRFVDPLVVDVVLARLAPGRWSEIVRLLVEAHEQAEHRQDHDPLRVARWRLDLGDPIDPAAALHAADLATSRSDFATAERLAAAAIRAGGDLPATVRLGEALMHQQRHAEAEEVLRPVGERLAELSDDLCFRYANARVLALSTDLGLLDEAIAVLEDAIAAMADDRSRWALEAHLAFRLADHGRLTAARPLAEARLANVAEDEPSALTAMVAGCLILTDGGRCLDALALCEAMTPVAWRHLDDRPEALAWIGAAQMLAHYTRGDFDAAMDVIETMSLFVPDGADPTVLAGLLMSRGLVLSERGQLDGALRLLQQSAALHALDNRRGYQAWCFAIESRVHAMRGELDAAAARLADARRHLWPGGQAFAFDVEVAAVWVAMLSGDRAGATRTLEDALASLEPQGEATGALRLRHEAVRAGLPVEPHVDAFAQTTVVEQSPWAAAQAAHIAALAADDGAALVAAGTAFAELGIHLVAAEAFAEAAGAHRRAGSTVLAAQAKQLSERERARCESAATPALRFGDLVVGLTDRELDVTSRAAAGQSNQEIAAGLGISVRTAETHLQRAFAKLGIHRRRDLASLFDPPTPSEPPT